MLGYGYFADPEPPCDPDSDLYERYIAEARAEDAAWLEWAEADALEAAQNAALSPAPAPVDPVPEMEPDPSEPPF